MKIKVARIKNQIHKEEIRYAWVFEYEPGEISFPFIVLTITGIFYTWITRQI